MSQVKIHATDQDNGKLILPIWMQNGEVKMIDQLLLPNVEKIIDINSVDQLCQAINKMNIRGSGALGLAGAYGMYLSWKEYHSAGVSVIDNANKLKMTRNTAVNLSRTIDEMLIWFDEKTNIKIRQIEEKISEIYQRQLKYEKLIGENGNSLISDGDDILTHCHSGALAGAGFGGRALSPIRTAWESGKKIHVYVSETRPFFQGSRITAYELSKWNIPYTIITDDMSSFLMRSGVIDNVIVGSDRVAANGDLINKIGTLSHAISAKYYSVPFYVSTSEHTYDSHLQTGDEFDVEIRDGINITQCEGVNLAPENSKAYYPAFDVTDHQLISAYITEAGVLVPPYTESLKLLSLEVNNGFKYSK